MNIATDKYCSKGKHYVNKKEFGKNGSHSDGLSSWCKKCYHDWHIERKEKKQKENYIKAF